MHRKKTLRIISIILVMVMLTGLSAYAFRENQDVSPDPFAQMKDEYLSDPRVTDDLQYEDVLRREDDHADILLPEETDAGKTDRYIVKYKGNSEAKFLNKLGNILETAEEFTPTIASDGGTFGIYRDVEDPAVESLSEKEADIVPKTTEVTSSNMRVLILKEKMLPTEFTEELKALGADIDIEYIQPDFELSLDNIGLELIDDTGDPDADETPEEELEKPDEPAPSEVPGEPEESEEPEESPSPVQKVLVAVIDTGLDTGHEIFEGYLHGDAPDTETDLLSYAHGTHIGGIIINAAKEAGADIELLPIKVFDNGNAYTSDIIAAIEYATAMGAQIVNCSFGSLSYNQALYEAIEASNALFVCAVGNNRRDFDAEPSYPAGYDLPNIISVASTNADGGFSYFSNYGSESIDLAALGRDVNSALPGNKYGTMTGTSMSAAYVTGAATSVLSFEEMTTEQLKNLLLNSADELSNLHNKVIDGKRLNTANAISGDEGSFLTLTPEDDFDVHGYDSTQDEMFDLYSASGKTIQVSAGKNHTLVLKENGTVWSWGDNGYNQCGNGTTSYSEALTQVVGLTDVVSIAAGEGHNLVLKGDGTVWVWGCNNYGQLGDGSTTDRKTPVQVNGLTGVVSVTTGYLHSLAVKIDGTVWAWGYNIAGQLGDGSGINRTTPVQVSGLTGVVSISVGYWHSLAVKTNGTVWAWGYNDRGQLGDSSTYRITPMQVSGLTGVLSVAAGEKHSLALKSDGTVWAWGFNNYGQLGNGSMTQRATPMQVNELTGVVSVAAGGGHNLALKSDNTVWTWGSNNYGQLGDDSTVQSTTPVKVNGLTGVVSVAGGYWYSLALKTDGTVWAWGDNYYGQLGDSSTYRATPVQVSGLTGFSSVVAGEKHSLALKHDGTVWAWGYNNHGQLGDGSTTNRTTPVQVRGMTGAVYVSAGYSHSLAVKTDGTVWAWGLNNIGQLGDGGTADKTIPVQVNGLTGVVFISAGYDYNLAVKSDGTVWAWGYNNRGQLGDGSTTWRTMPVKVSGLTGAVSIAAGYEHSLAVKTDGTVWAWGSNISGQLGNASTANSTIPVRVWDLTDVVSVSAGDSHSLALKSGGTVWAWGCNGNGQLGIGNTTNLHNPWQVNGLTDVVSIAAGKHHSLAVKTDGTVWAWGYNYYGQLGNDSTAQSTTPLKVSGIAGVSSIAAGIKHSLAVKTDGTVRVWGADDYCQLGLGRIIQSSTPIKAVTSISKLELLFDQVVYGLAIPDIDLIEITVRATAYDADGQPIPNANVTYCLAEAYPGVSIENVTGVVSVTSETFPGEVWLKASYGGLEATAQLILREAGAFDSELELEVEEDGCVYIALTARDIVSFEDMSFIITYDDTQLQLLDAAVQAYGSNITAGLIPGTGITIEDLSDGELILTFDKQIPQGKTWSGTVTILKFKALETGTVSISVS